MKVIPVEFDLDLTQSRQGYVRSGGLHMSDIYGSLYRELEPERYGRGDIDKGTKDGYLGVGLAWEETLEEALRTRLSAESGRPDEMVEPEHGIIYSPDLIIFNHVTRLGEIKLTWLSSREFPKEPTNGFPPKAEKYLTQMMAYCRCLETPYARLYALFVNGSYDRKQGLKPEPRAWDIEFTRREMDENWQTLINHARAKKML